MDTNKMLKEIVSSGCDAMKCVKQLSEIAATASVAEKEVTECLNRLNQFPLKNDEIKKMTATFEVVQVLLRPYQVDKILARDS